MTRPDPAFPALQDAMRVGMGDGQAPFNANAQTLDDLIGSSAGLAEVSAGIAENQAQQAEIDANEKFGAAMVSILDGIYGEGFGRQFRNDAMAKTAPGTPARAKSDRAWAKLTQRLKAAGETP